MIQSSTVPASVQNDANPIVWEPECSFATAHDNPSFLRSPALNQSLYKGAAEEKKWEWCDCCREAVF